MSDHRLGAEDQARSPEGTRPETDAGDAGDDLAPGGLTGGLSRRQFLGGAAALAAGLALPALPGVTDAAAAGDEPGRGAPRPSHRPNFVFLITDQERYPQHWPAGWARENLPNRQRLARHGLTFTRAFCAASMCSPSRASIFTGLYPAEHGVTEVLQYGTKDYEVDQHTLHPSTQNMAKLLKSAGYNVQYRGKWHMSKDPSGTLAVQSRRDLERYHFDGWLTPDAGGDESSAMFGGGTADYDRLTARQAAAFLRSANPRSSTPFALFVCLVNPHDVMGCPKTWFDPSYSDIRPYHGSGNYADDYPACVRQDIDLPATWDERPWDNFKPHCQWQSTEMWSVGLDPILSRDRMLDYVNFYAYLHRRSDEDMGTVLDALEGNGDLNDRTVVIRLSDHGEMGLAHGGMREKAYSAYEETMHVPLVISNPRWFPRAVRTGALASTVDLFPTLASLADVPRPGRWRFRGRDLTPVIRDAVKHPRNPKKRVQSSVMYTTDETIGSRPGWVFKDGIVKQPAHVRAIREERYKFAMYFDPEHPYDPLYRQYELYDLQEDPHELHNMAAPENTEWYDRDKVEQMQDKLAARMAQTHTTPGGGVPGASAGAPAEDGTG